MLQETFKKDNKLNNYAEPVSQDLNDSLDIQSLIELSYKPIDVILGGCLKLNKVTSKIILNPKPEDPVPPKTKNLIINWEKIKCNVKERITVLGVEKCDPNEYIEQHGSSLIQASTLPAIANKVAVDAVENQGTLLASDVRKKYFNELEGDVHALSLIDLDKEGLSEYKYILENLRNNKNNEKNVNQIN